MKFKQFMAGLAILFSGTTLSAQFAGDVLGVHNLGPGGNPNVTGARTDACSYCHAPHSGLSSGLWNQTLTALNYKSYSSTTEKNTGVGVQPTYNGPTHHCLSCHDGAVAVGTTVAYGQVTTNGSMTNADKFGNDLRNSHPVSMMKPLKDNVDLVASIAATGRTGDTAAKLINGNVECTSCHNPHVQATDLISQNFLVKDSSSGQLCLTCHDPTRQVGSQVNPLTDWPTSAHAVSSGQVAPQAQVGSYRTVAQTACISCHTPHNGSGAARLLRGQNEGDCIACHNGANVSPMPPYANVFAEYNTGAGKVGHPIPAGSNLHDAAEDTLLNNNRHATCVDCHNGHGSEIVGVFPPAPLIRLSQKNIAGINASDGTSVLTPAINQYENCLRCHAASSGKQTLIIYGYHPARVVAAGDPLNEVSQFSASAPSRHPVTQPRGSTSQPSLLFNMLKFDGTAGRAMGQQILCTDCHNSDDNREFGGQGANGPHGSTWTHILERRYEFSQAVTPGGEIGNLFKPADLSSTGPYSLCAKCHNLSIVITAASWSGHAEHINAGFTCSVCHTAHGVGTTSGSISGERLVDFDAKVVAANAASGLPITYNHSTNTCVLVCHGATHNSDHTVSNAIGARAPVARR